MTPTERIKYFCGRISDGLDEIRRLLGQIEAKAASQQDCSAEQAAVDALVLLVADAQAALAIAQAELAICQSQS